jgi:hypothetical protein
VALLLVPLGTKTSPQTHKMLYVATTGSDTAPAKPDATLQNHGWVVAFDVDDWKQVGHWLATTNSFGGGIWQSSQGPAADDHGNVYVVTSNGGYLVNSDGSKKDFSGQTDFAESFVKLSVEAGPARHAADALRLVLAVPRLGAQNLDNVGSHAIHGRLQL